MLAAGALVGLVGGLLAQLALSDVETELRPLVRLAMLLPAGTFVAWWLLLPGISLERADGAEQPAPESSESVDRRLERIEATFTGVDGAYGRSSHAPAVDVALRDEYRASIRRGTRETSDRDRYAVRRADAPLRDEA